MIKMPLIYIKTLFLEVECQESVSGSNKGRFMARTGCEPRKVNVTGSLTCVAFLVPAETPLHCAIRYHGRRCHSREEATINSMKSIELLVKSGADLTLKVIMGTYAIK